MTVARWLVLVCTLVLSAASVGSQEAPTRFSRAELGGEAVEFSAIPAGEFLMGTDAEEGARIQSRLDLVVSPDEAPMHRVKVSAFELGVTEVTVGQYQAYCRATGKEMPRQEEWNNTPQHPVHYVNWDEAVAYCVWATSELKRQGQPGTIRLPTEAEWEFAARGRDTGVNGRARKLFVWGDDLPRTEAPVANLSDARARAAYPKLNVKFFFPNYDDGYAQAAPVGKFPANAYGLRDMAGNLWEWCQDRYDREYYARSPLENPQGSDNPEDGARVFRGGSWYVSPTSLRVSKRNWSGPSFRYLFVGFRLLRTAQP